MQKSERINAAKKLVQAVVREEKADPALAKALKSEGCTLTKDGKGWHFVDADGKGYQLVPKGRMVIQYDRNDWIEFRALDEMLAESKSKKQAKKVLGLLGNVRAKTLRAALIEQIESRGVEVKIEEPKAEESKEKKSAKPAKPEKKSPQFPELAAQFEGVKFKSKGEGCCIWASGNVEKHEKALKAAGFVWSGKKSAYYRRAA